MMRSIRASLVAGTTITTVVVLLVAGGYVYYGVRTALLEQFDSALHDDAEIVTSLTDVYPSKVKLDLEVLDLSDFAAAGSGFLQIWVDDAMVIHQSPSLGGVHLEPFGGTVTEPEFRTKEFGGRRVRAVSMTFAAAVQVPDADEDVTDPTETVVELDSKLDNREVMVVLARTTESMDALLARLQRLLMILGVVAPAIAVTTLWFVIRKNLSPLDSLARRIAALRATDVDSEIRLSRVPTEIQPVVDRLNELLQRMDAAMQRERSFSAHVAHELRTPVAALRSTMEVARSRPREPEDYEAAITECLAVVQEMQEMVVSLLYLFRLEAGQIEAKSDLVDVRELVLDCWAHLQDTARARRLQVHYDLPSPVVVPTDGGLLTLAIRNILENAVVHSDEGGIVRVGVSNGDQRVKLRVRNSGSSIAPDRVPMLFDRFWRGDEARSSTGVHNGLGLSVVKKVADVLGCGLQVESRDGEFDITLSLDNTARRSTAA